MVKREKPETTNQKPETESLNKSGKRGRCAKVSICNSRSGAMYSESFEERPILSKYKEGDNFNHRNTFSISRIEI